MKEDILKEKSFQLAESIVEFCGRYSKTCNYILSNQLLRCGTSIGACVAEAGAAQTRRDFITKLSIASKEARETLYWLNLIKSNDFDTQKCEALISETEEIIKILTSSVKTAQKNEKTKP
jgi:four helix bundle protein